MLIRYAVADDHPLYREALCSCLSKDPAFRCVGAAGDGRDLLALVQREPLDVVLLDYNMPRLNGLQALQQLRVQEPVLPVLVLTQHAHPWVVQSFLEAGANGFLLKVHGTAAEIRTALRDVVKNRYHFNQHVTPALVRRLAVRQPHPGAAQFSVRELAVLRLICEGQSSAEIGKRIFASPRTVERIRAALQEKTGTPTAAGLAAFAVQVGLYPAADPG